MSPRWKRYGFRPLAPGLLLLGPWFWLGPFTADADVIAFNLAQTNQTGLSWSDPNNWSPRAPAPGDDVLFTTPSGAGNFTVMNFDAGTLTLNSLTVGQADTNITNLNLGSGSSLTANVVSIGNSGWVLLSDGAALAATVTLNQTGYLASDASTINNLAGATLNNTGGGLFGAQLYVDNGSVLLNDASTFNNTAGAQFATGSAAGAGNPNSFVNQNGGQVINDASWMYNQNGTLTNTGPASLTNQNGGWLQSAGPGFTYFNNLNGALLINTGTNPAPSLGLPSSSTFVNGYVVLNDASTINNLAGATLDNFGGVYGGLTNQDGGVLVNDASTINNSTTPLTNTSTDALGNPSATSIIVNRNGGLLVNDYGGALNNLAGAVLTNTSTDFLGNPSATSFIINQGASTITNDASTLNNVAGATLTNSGLGTALYNQNGAILNNSDPNTLLQVQNNAVLYNDSSTLNNVNQATLSVGTGGNLINQNGGTILNDTGATLVIASGGYLGNDASSTLTNNSSFENSGVVDNSGTINGTGAYTQTGGETLIESGASFTQGTLDLQGGTFETYDSTHITGNATNSGGDLTIYGPYMIIDGSYTQTAPGTSTPHMILINGVLDPTSIDIEGGTFGGTGTVDGDLTLDDATLQVGDPTGQLLINGDFSQTGGEILLEVTPDGPGGFVESTLEFNPGSAIYMNGVDFVFDFENGANPSVFSADGLFNIDAFLKLIGGAGFLSDYGSILSGDSFTEEQAGAEPVALSFNPANGDLWAPGSTVPEPDTLALLLPVLAILGCTVRRRKLPQAGKEQP